MSKKIPVDKLILNMYGGSVKTEEKEKENKNKNKNDDSDSSSSDSDSDVKTKCKKTNCDVGDVVQSQTKNNNSQIVFSEIKTASIPLGTILYHTSDRKTFNPIIINVSDGGTLSAFFTTNLDIAKGRIGNCSEFDENGKVKERYIHKFRVKREIDKLYMFSEYDVNWNLEIINKDYCGKGYNGVGFYLLKTPTSNNDVNDAKEIKYVSKNEPTNDDDSNITSAEYALCNPVYYLEYINTMGCKSIYKYTAWENFNS